MLHRLKFGLDTIEEIKDEEENLYEQMKKSRFAKVKIRLFGTGENAHTEPVDIDALKKSADSAYDIPLIAELNPYRGNEDFGGHGVLTGEQFSFGFIKEAKDNPIVFEKDSVSGKIFLTLYGLIWKNYFENVVNILTSRGSETEVSVELDVLGDEVSAKGKPIMKQFVLNAVTFLGKVTSAACKGARAQLAFSEKNSIEFENDKKEYYETMNFEKDSIKIINSKETAVDGKWVNPRQKLLSPILNASNKIALLNEAYLFWEDKGEEGITLSDVSYPHHVIKDGNLVLHIRGVQAAFSRLAQQGKVEGKAKEHLLRHYKTLGLSTENFSEFGLTQEQFDLYFAKDLTLGKEENMDKINIDEKTPDGVDLKDLDADIVDDQKMSDSDEGKEDCECEHCECKETEKMEGCDDEDGKEDFGCDDKEEKKMSCEEMEKRIAELEDENRAYMEKVEAMSDYEDLKKFKEETLAKEKEAAEVAAMAHVFEELSNSGVEFTDDQKKELESKRAEFSNDTAWSNFVKAFVFDNISSKEDGIIKFENVNKNSSKEENKSIWTAMEKQFG